MKTIVFYHKDLDGICAAAVVNDYYGWDENIVNYPINYGETFPWDIIESNDVVYMVDFSMRPIEDMVKLNNKANVFYWIDHHVTSITEYENYCKNNDFSVAGSRKIGLSGCELSWQYMRSSEIPEFIKLIGIYDTWRFTKENEEKIKQFHFGLDFLTRRSNDCTLKIWKDLFEGDCYLDEIYDIGKTIIDYLYVQNSHFCRKFSFEMNWEGLDLICLNTCIGSSSAFDSIWDHDKYDAMLVFRYDGSGYSYSLYSDKPGIDVSVIAKKYGGGGHKGAAGFASNKLLF